MTDDYLAMLRGVLAEPDDDGPRLVLSDWLEENGQPDRAEFVRLQCRIARIEATCSCGRCVKLRGGGQHTNGPCGVDRERDELPDGRSRQAFLRCRERELLEGGESAPRNYYRWAGSVGALPAGRDGCFWEFRRGFVEAVTCTAADWIAHGDAILARQPVREATLTTQPELEFGPHGGKDCPQDVRLRGRTWRHTDESLMAATRSGPDMLRTALLAAEWPGVKTWCLPQSRLVWRGSSPYASPPG
jgi:uncharacterized protein (TIGR02996 family)